MKNLSSELLNLMSRISLENNTQKAIHLFVSQLNRLFETGCFYWDKSKYEKLHFKVATSNNHFGFINHSSELPNLSAENIDLIQDTSQVLARILETTDSQLLKKANFQNAVIDNIMDSIISTDTEKLITNWNNESEVLYGWSKDEALGKEIDTLLRPEYPNESPSEILLCLKNKNRYIGEIIHHHKNGSAIDIKVSISNIKDLSGHIIGTTSFNHNITQEKAIRKKILNSENQFKTMIERSNDMIWMLDLKGNLSFFNHQVENGLGIKFKDWQGKSFTSLVYEEDIPKLNELFVSSLKNNPQNYELRVRNKNGNPLFLSVNTAAIFSENEVKGVVSFGRDITAQKKSNIQIAKNEARRKELIANISDVISIIDTNGLVSYKSPNIKKLFGWDPEELIGKNGFKNIHDADKNRLKQEFEILLETENSKIVTEFQYLCKDGCYKNVQCTAVNLSQNENINGILLNYHDISDQKKHEVELQKALNKSNESDRLKSAFLATMSHELRTPLNAIMGFSDILKESTEDKTTLDYANIIYTSGNHLLNILNDLFDITLIEAGETKINNKQTNLNQVFFEIDNLIKVEKEVAKKPSLNINMITPINKRGLTVDTDAVKLKQILINLLKNAIKFTNSGQIHYGYEIETIDNKQMVKFFVKDSGIGISVEKQRFIFDVFRQIDDSHTRQFGGLGIGLSIAKKLTKILHGNIWVKSNIGEGSTFYFTIPYNAPVNENNQKTPNQNKTTKEPFYYLKDKTVLIVEDDRDSYIFLKLVLERQSMNTIWAENGEMAIQYCNDYPNIDLVLMDLNLPILTGYDATITIKNTHPTIPIIAQTAFAIAGDKEHALEVGCDDYISKPIKKGALIDLLLKYLTN